RPERSTRRGARVRVRARRRCLYGSRAVVDRTERSNQGVQAVRGAGVARAYGEAAVRSAFAFARAGTRCVAAFLDAGGETVHAFESARRASHGARTEDPVA